MKRLVIVLAIMALLTVTAVAKLATVEPTMERPNTSRATEVWFYDDIESGAPGWSTADLSATASPHFHWDTYLAYMGQSWWCGNFDYDADGGYGNSWDDRLNIQSVDLTGATYPILTYAFRHDSEVGYDFTYVQAESMGSYVNLNRGYDGYQAWTDIGVYGFILATYDNPLNARFRFISDGAWSDEDGLYLSNGGAFHCDIVKVFDYFTGYVFFYDDADANVNLVPSVPSAAGDYWHVIDKLCPAYSDPHSWWCGDDADTNLIPGNLQNGLFSPVVDLSAAATCTARFALHFAIPQVDNDYVAFYGGVGYGYYGIASYWGDFGQCDGWGSSGFAGFDISQFDDPPYGMGGFLWVFYTTDNGCGPTPAGNMAGLTVDDFWLEGELLGVPVEETSWGSIKAMYQ
jgi:hypothetical protein